MDNKNLRPDTSEDVTWGFMNVFSERRKELNLSVRELGEKANVSYTVIYDLEQRYTLPKMETLLKIATALGFYVDIKYSQGELNLTFCIDEKIVTLKPKKSQIPIEEQLNKLLSKKGLQTKEIEEIRNFIDFKLSQHKK